MNQFFPGFEEFEAEMQQKSERSYEARMLNRMLNRLVDEDDARSICDEAADEFGFEWFNTAYNPFVHITASKLKNINPVDLLAKSLMKKPIGQEFIQMRATYEEGVAVGVVFPIKSASNWIIHDGAVPIVPGVTAVIRKGHDGSQLTILSFDAFVDGLKQRWQP
jgi:hypothetical protein